MGNASVYRQYGNVIDTVVRFGAGIMKYINHYNTTSAGKMLSSSLVMEWKCCRLTNVTNFGKLSQERKKQGKRVQEILW